MMRAIPGAQAPGGEADTAAPVRPSGDGSLFEGLERSQMPRLPPPTSTSRRSTIRTCRDGGKSLVAGRGILLRNLHDPRPPKGGEPSEIRIFCLVFGRADTLCQTSISRFVSIPARLSKRRRPRRLDHCRSAPLRYGGSRLPPPRLRISSSVVGISFGDGIGGLVTRRASCGAAVLVPVRRNTAPLLLPPASMPSRA
jgi:hypothetical protein